MPTSSDLPLPRWKRTIDLFCCALAFPFFIVLAMVMTLLTKLTSPGVIFFRQERVGLNGSRFKIYKFRTMHLGADTKGHQNHFTQLVQTNSPMVKLDAKRDSRLIAGGWLLRSTGLDELPQIVNVWRGEMSIVGPRPCIPYEYDQYTPAQRERFDSVPGLTGLWQVSGKNRTTFARMIELDRNYTAQKSFSLDIKIILLTVPALIGQVVDVVKARSRVATVNAQVHTDSSSPHAMSVSQNAASGT
jgi:lipopolysaccharide/colanic/teichoic acid biosynthesis glycosyltransferase